MKQLEHSAWGQSFQLLDYEVPVTSITVLSVPAASSVMLPGSLVFSRNVSVSALLPPCLCLWSSPAMFLSLLFSRPVSGLLPPVSGLLSPCLWASPALSLVFSAISLVFYRPLSGLLPPCLWSSPALCLVFSRPVSGLLPPCVWSVPDLCLVCSRLSMSRGQSAHVNMRLIGHGEKSSILIQTISVLFVLSQATWAVIKDTPDII